MKPGINSAIPRLSPIIWLGRSVSTLIIVMLMSRLVALFAVVLGGLAGASNLPAADTNSIPVPATKVAITNLLAHKEEYKGKWVEVTGYYTGFFEHYVLYEAKAQRDQETSLWIDPWGEAPGYKEKLSRGSPAEFRGNVRVIGTFEYRPGARAGHMGACPARIIKLELFEEI